DHDHEWGKWPWLIGRSSGNEPVLRRPVLSCFTNELGVEIPAMRYLALDHPLQHLGGALVSKQYVRKLRYAVVIRNDAKVGGLSLAINDNHINERRLDGCDLHEKSTQEGRLPCSCRPRNEHVRPGGQPA